MIELLKKTMLMSLGLAFVTKDKIEVFVKELVEKGKLSGNEGKEFFENLLQKSEESSLQIEEKINKTVKDSLKKMNIATQDDLLKITRQLEELKKSVEKQKTGQD